jgi:hypothetical protein
MTISLFESWLPWLSIASTIAIVVMAIQGTWQGSFSVSGSNFARSSDPAGYWAWFALYWTCATIGVIVTLALFGLDVRFWL